MSSSLISQEFLQTIKNKNYRLIFCIGLPGSNKESQIENVSNEFKYSKICVKDIIEKEISEIEDSYETGIEDLITFQNDLKKG